MEEIYIGDLIKRRRHELGLTQENLCFGICEPMTISRIENGKQLPSPSHLKAILERLDLPEDGICKYLGQKEYDNEQKINGILKQFVKVIYCDESERIDEFNRMLNLIDLLKNENDISSPDYQLLTLIKNGLLLRENELSLDEYIEQITDIINKTNPKFQLCNISKCLYSYVEFTAIILLARAYHMAGDNAKSSLLFNQLIQYAKEHETLSNSYNHLLIYLMVNYLSFLEDSKKYDDTYQLSLYCQKQCIEKEEYHFLPIIVEIEADCLMNLKKEKNEILELYKEAYYCYRLLDEDYRANIVKQKIDGIK